MNETWACLKGAIAWESMEEDWGGRKEETSWERVSRRAPTTAPWAALGRVTKAASTGGGWVETQAVKPDCTCFNLFPSCEIGFSCRRLDCPTTNTSLSLPSPPAMALVSVRGGYSLDSEWEWQYFCIIFFYCIEVREMRPPHSLTAPLHIIIHDSINFL